MNTKRKSYKRNVKKNKKDLVIQRELRSIILISFGIITLFSLFSKKMGIVGYFLYKICSFLFGSGNFIFPILLIIWGGLYSNKKTKDYFYNYFVSGTIIFLCILIFLDGTKSSDLTLIDRISLSVEYLDITTSGGIIGSILGFFTYKLFGLIGSYIILTIIIFINLYLLFKINIDSFKNFSKSLETMKSNINLKKLETKKVNNDKEIKGDKFELSSDNEKKESSKLTSLLSGLKNKEKINKEDNVVIRDYTGNEQEEYSFENLNKLILSNNKDKVIKKENTKINNEIKNNNTEKKYIFPPIDLLEKIERAGSISNEEIINNGKIIEDTMKNFGIDSKIIAINKGPVITCYELEPAPGVKLSKIVALNDNLSMNLASSDIRIEAPIPGKSVVGIEIPNKKKEAVGAREIIESSKFKNLKSNLPLALGKDVSGEIIISSIDKMPHLLIAGATGSGKSVCINTIITNLIYKSSPKDVKLMLIDPKVVELNVYNGIPHLLIPVVTDPKKAAFSLNWAVGEMEKRYKIFAKYSVRDLQSYNKKMEVTKEDDLLPKIVIIIDELADLMMVAQNDVEDYIARLAQMARAAGIYLIIATQRPSVDVITGTIKANIPSRIAFAVSSAIDSRTILDMSGAEKLLGKGDMLFYPSYMSKPLRIQGSFISDVEVERVVDFIKENSNEKKNEDNEIVKAIEIKNNKFEEDRDELFNEAVDYIIKDEQASISFLQRKLKIGYSRAARIIDQIEECGIIGPHEGSKPRKLLLDESEIKKILGGNDE